MVWPSEANKTAFNATVDAQDGLTAGEKTTLHTAVDSIAVAPALFGKVICDGDSLTKGVSTTTPYPTLLQSQLGATWSVVNLGTGGEQLPQILSGGAAVDSAKDPAATINVCVVWGGTNDLNQQRTPDQIYTDIVAYSAARRAAGLKVIVIPVIARYQTTLPANFETSRQALNTLIRNNWRTFADGICDIDRDVRFADPLITPPFLDNVHLNTVGNGWVADYVAASILGLLP